MSIFLLWFSIFSFTIFLLAVFPVALRWKRRNRPLHGTFYLCLMLNIGIWLILFSFLYFSDAFVNPLTPLLRTVFGILRSLISVAFLVFYSYLIRELGADVFRGRGRLLIYVMPVAYTAMILPVFLRASVFFSILLTVTYNLFVCLSSVCMIIRLRKNCESQYYFFFRLMAVYHAAAALLIILPFQRFSFDTQMVLSVLPRAVFCLSWGLIELLLFISSEYRRERRQADAVSASFVREYGITAREQDVICSIAGGYSNRETAERLFISEKTVETHIYSIYKKCGVKNKVGLLNLLSNFG